MKTLLRLLLSWVVLVVFVAAVRQLSAYFFAYEPDRQLIDAMGLRFTSASFDLLAIAATLGFILLGSWLTGLIARHFRQPMLTGYLVFGVLVGPHLFAVLGRPEYVIVSEEQLHILRLANLLAISLIALTAGGEIRIDYLRQGLRQIGLITGAGIVFPLVVVGGVLLILRGHIDVLASETLASTVTMCLILGCVSMANSPATIVAMLAETRATGPMAQVSLAVTVCKDLCLVVIFTVILAVAVNFVGDSSSVEAGAAHLEVLAKLAWHLLGSIGVGAVLGTLLAHLIGQVGNRIPILVVAWALGTALLSEALNLEALLVAMTAGFVMANFWPQRSEPLFHTIEELALPVYCVFFALAGASVDIAAVMRLWPVALLIVGLRLVAIWGGTWLGVKLGGLPAPAGRWLFTAFIPQAGIAIALAATVAETFRDQAWAAPTASLILAVVAIHQLIGPIGMRLGLVRSGEADA